MLLLQDTLYYFYQYRLILCLKSFIILFLVSRIAFFKLEANKNQKYQRPWILIIMLYNNILILIGIKHLSKLFLLILISFIININKGLPLETSYIHKYKQ